MSNKILVTDSLFIFDEHVKKLEAEGFEVVRLDKPEATEDELVEAVKGKAGYILGGVEKVTRRVVDAANDLKVIAFAGIGYKWLIPAWEYVTEKGILITNTPDAPTHAPAEWAMMAALAMQRGIFEIGRTGTKTFKTFSGLEGINVGIYGLGRIGTEVARLLQPFEPASINYCSTHKHENAETELGLIFKDENSILAESDVLFICVPDEVGKDYFDLARLEKVKNTALIVSIAHEGIINTAALEKTLARGVRVANDDPLPELSKKYGPDKLFTNLGHNAFNTHAGLKRASDMATQSIINILKTGKDQYVVNQ